MDIESPHTISALYRLLKEPKNEIYRQVLKEADIDELDVGLLRGPNRMATTVLSAMLRGTTIEGGRTPLGIVYGSKHGFGKCFAVYTDRHDHVPASEGEFSARYPQVFRRRNSFFQRFARAVMS